MGSRRNPGDHKTPLPTQLLELFTDIMKKTLLKLFLAITFIIWIIPYLLWGIADAIVEEQRDKS